MHYSCIERLMLAKRHQETTWLTRLCSTNSNDEYDITILLAATGATMTDDLTVNICKGLPSRGRQASHGIFNEGSGLG